jgi:hypothetical protein
MMFRLVQPLLKSIIAIRLALLEKQFIRTPERQYWCRSITITDTNNRADFLYRPT